MTGREKGGTEEQAEGGRTFVMGCPNLSCSDKRVPLTASAEVAGGEVGTKRKSLEKVSPPPPLQVADPSYIPPRTVSRKEQIRSGC